MGLIPAPFVVLYNFFSNTIETTFTKFLKQSLASLKIYLQICTGTGVNLYDMHRYRC